jgi:hypothetical protein
VQFLGDITNCSCLTVDLQMGNSSARHASSDAEIFDESVRRAVTTFRKHSNNVNLLKPGADGKKKSIVETSDEVEEAMFNLIERFSEISTRSERYRKLQAIMTLLGCMIEDGGKVKDSDVIALLQDLFHDLDRRIVVGPRILTEEEYFPSPAVDEADALLEHDESFMTPERRERSRLNTAFIGGQERDEARSAPTPTESVTRRSSRLNSTPNSSSRRIVVKDEED